MEEDDRKGEMKTESKAKKDKSSEKRGKGVGLI